MGRYRITAQITGLDKIVSNKRTPYLAMSIVR